jgi:hypothetical protein
MFYDFDDLLALQCRLHLRSPSEQPEAMWGRSSAKGVKACWSGPSVRPTTSTVSRELCCAAVCGAGGSGHWQSREEAQLEVQLAAPPSLSPQEPARLTRRPGHSDCDSDGVIAMQVGGEQARTARLGWGVGGVEVGPDPGPHSHPGDFALLIRVPRDSDAWGARSSPRARPGGGDACVRRAKVAVAAAVAADCTALRAAVQNHDDCGSVTSSNSPCASP